MYLNESFYIDRWNGFFPSPVCVCVCVCNWGGDVVVVVVVLVVFRWLVGFAFPLFSHFILALVLY